MTEPDAPEEEYNDSVVAMLELIWGEGFLSPGGPEAVNRIVAGLDLADKLVIDIGCGIGGIDVLLAGEHGARVIGLDVEQGVIERARRRVLAAGVEHAVELRHYEPGPLPLDDASADVVFGKDSWIHVADKRALFAEMLRVLKPGGMLAAGDWMRGPDPYSADMAYFFELEGLTYHMDTAENYVRDIVEVGFVDVELEDISRRYRREARREYESMRDELRPRMTEVLGPDATDHYIENWRMLCVVLDNGELRPGRFRARRPLD